MSWKAVRLVGAITITLASGTLFAHDSTRDRSSSAHAAPQVHSGGQHDADARHGSKPKKPKPQKNPFVVRKGADLYLKGERFRFAGSNNYYPIYKSQLMVDALFDKAKAQGFDVMRVWGALDIGNEDGSNSVDGEGKKENVYFQYWNGSQPAYHDGPDGLERLDYVIYKAGQNGLKLVIPFVNNWREFGGMDQYVRWRGGQYHDDFYTDPVIREWYKAWIAHLLNRVNTFTGVQYKNDPTIMTWELANEPRCIGSGVYPRSPSCTAETLVEWADDVSTFIKTIDRNHLVSAGDEGFYCDPAGTDWTDNCNEGVDTVAFTKLKHVDVMSFHLYPDSWGKTPEWGTEWITRHIRDANRIGKPVMLGEFGIHDKNLRNAVYKEWTDAFLKARGDGALYWILSDVQDDGTLYPDYDGLTVYCPSPVCTTFTNFGWMMEFGFPLPFSPVADHDAVETAFDTSVSAAPLTNDIAYKPFKILPGTVDLNPSMAGQQTSLTTASGVFTLGSGGIIDYTPTPGFVGEAVLAYTVKDSARRSTNVANLRVTVRPAPGAAITLFSFESGTDGWGSINGLPATFAQSPDFATDGSSSLRIDVGSSADWFGANLAAPLDLSDKTRLLIDMTLVGPGQGHNVVLQVGSGWTWCEGPAWVNADADSSTVIEIDLTAMGCRADHNDVKAIWLFLGSDRTYYLDAVRAE
jgi:mannan endo-1,4-beta-mannosidase